MAISKQEKNKRWYDKNKEYFKEYRQRLKPDQKEKKKEHQRRYHQQPAVKKRAKEYVVEYNKRPYVKALKRQYAQKYYSNPENKEKQKFRQLKSHYNITIDEYDNLLKSQNGKCAICGISFGVNMPPHIDHDHNTNKVRGLLCFGCNIGIGNLKDDISILKNAIEYLYKHKS